MNYIISLTHTYPHEKYITLWGVNNQGYCFSKEMAGLYEQPKEGYHNSEGNMPLPIDVAESLFEVVDYFGEKKKMIPNTPAIWKKFGVRMNKRSGHLVRTKATFLAPTPPAT